MQFIQSKPKEGFSLDFRGSKDFGKDDILGHWLDILTKEKWQDILEATWNWKQGSLKCSSVYYLFFLSVYLWISLCNYISNWNVIVLMLSFFVGNIISREYD